jgi:DNA-binding NtrC family response regulator
MTKKTKILVLEDDALIRMMTVGILEDAHFTVVEAGCIKKAEEIMRDQGDEIACIIPDKNLSPVERPDPKQETGWAFAKRMQQKFDIPVVRISGQKPTAEEEMQYAGMPFLRKPFLPGDLIVAVKKTIGPSHPTGGHDARAGFEKLKTCRAA